MLQAVALGAAVQAGIYEGEVRSLRLYPGALPQLQLAPTMAACTSRAALHITSTAHGRSASRDGAAFALSHEPHPSCNTLTLRRCLN